MEWIKGVQEAVPWLAGLPLLPKSIASALILGAAAFLLTLIWTPPPVAPDQAIAAILKGCYRRALLTRTMREIDYGKMVNSITACQSIVVDNIPKIKTPEFQSVAQDIVAALDEIQRGGVSLPDNAKVKQVDNMKLIALNALSKLAKATGTSYPLPAKGQLLPAKFFFTQEEADAPPSYQELNL